MKKRLRTQTGFTLMEVLMVSIIGAALGGIFITFMRMHNNAVNEGAAMSIIQTQAGVVASEITRKVRAASQVIAPDETWAVAQNLPVRNVNEIVLYTRTGTVAGAFRIEDGKLKESSDGIAFQPFLSGDKEVALAAGSLFRLSAKRTETGLYLKVAILYREVNYETPALGEMILCRN